MSSLTPHERKKHWDMSFWGKKTDCGTVACAAGHCAQDPWFRRRGFKLEFDSEGNGAISAIMNEFFGLRGQQIFLNTDRRSVGTVIQEVKHHIKCLKEFHEGEEV